MERYTRPFTPATRQYEPSGAMATSEAALGALVPPCTSSRSPLVMEPYPLADANHTRSSFVGSAIKASVAVKLPEPDTCSHDAPASVERQMPSPRNPESPSPEAPSHAVPVPT